MKNYQASHRQLFRSRDGWIFGVCKGLANYFEVSVFWTRLGFIFAIMISALVPMLIIYIVAAIFMKPEPMIPLVNPEDWDFYNSYTSDRHMAINRLREKLDTLDRRTQRIEAVLGSKEHEWEQKMKQA
ncbi:MAG: PspC domain-containing protein [Verrucomicrobiota bacterium]|nr:PspC domain-containing protein [Verrucomicrobiota bacterium]